MRVFQDPGEFQAACIEARRQGDLGFVPTMGYLHAGHESLMRAAARHRTSALSIFVNPTQFGPTEDLGRYPRDLDGDLRKAEQCGIQLVFTPRPEDIYPAGFQTFVAPGAISQVLEGECRPGHFGGMATVVLKLFQLAQPSHAYFGRKDFQQLAIVRRMALDFDLPLEVVGMDTVREPDGLAMSSRNAYLSPADRQRALSLSRGLQAARRAFDAGERSAEVLEKLARAEVEQGTDRIDYVSVRDAASLTPVVEAQPGKAVVLIAAFVGSTRLIDNAVLGE